MVCCTGGEGPPKGKVGALFSFKRKEVSETFGCSVPLYKTRYVVLLAAYDPGLAWGKLLCILSRKVGKACTRNRLRRLAKAIFLEKRLYLEKFRYILLFKPKAKLGRVEIERILDFALTKGG